MVENARQLYETRNDIIDAFEDIKNLQKKPDKQENLEWLEHQDYFKKLTKDLVLNFGLSFNFSA